MQFVDFEPGCAPTGMLIAQTTPPVAGPGEVVVKVAAFGLNRADTLQRMGRYPPPAGESLIMGLEVAGEVISTGEGVDIWQPGDLVFGLVPGGGYAEQVKVRADHLMPVPQGVELHQAAGIAEVFLTALQALDWLGQLQQGQKLLVHAGASGVGLAATQLASVIGAEVAVTASSEAKLAQCQARGAHLLINYKTDDFADVIRQQWGGVDVIVDFVGGDYLNRNLKILNQDGHIVYLAMLAGRYADQLDMGLLLAKRASIIGSTLRNRSNEYKARLINHFSQQYLPLFASGQLQADIDSLISVEDIASGHQRLETNQTKGKLIASW